MDFLNFWKYLIFLGLLVQFSNGYPRENFSSDNLKFKNSNDIDIIIFTQSWPQTVCYQWKIKSQSNQCNLLKNDEWSIHGLWPSQFHKMGPSFCNNNLPFDPEALKSIRAELDNKWMDVHKGGQPESFWKHEWTKHGTCAINLDNINSEETYFQKGLDLFDEYDMNNVLNKANISPGGTYPVKKILNGVNEVLGVNSQVMCQKNPKTNEQYLMEIRICFDKKFNLKDCDGITSFPTNCNRSIDVTY